MSLAKKDDAGGGAAREGSTGSAYTSNDLKIAFNDLDDNHDGYLSYDELRDCLLRGHSNFPEKALRVLWRSVDQDKDGKVDFDEFIDFIFGKKVKTAKQKWQDTFMAYTGTDGRMDVEEFQRLCEGVGLYDLALDENGEPDPAARSFGQKDAIVIFCKVCAEGLCTMVTPALPQAGKAGNHSVVREWRVEAGDFVKKGDIIATISVELEDYSTDIVEVGAMIDGFLTDVFLHVAHKVVANKKFCSITPRGILEPTGFNKAITMMAKRKRIKKKALHHLVNDASGPRAWEISREDLLKVDGNAKR